MTDSYKNTSGTPRDLDDGRVVAPGEIAKIKTLGPIAQAHVDAEALLPLSSGTRLRAASGSGGGDKNASGGKS